MRWMSSPTSVQCRLPPSQKPAIHGNYEKRSTALVASSTRTNCPSIVHCRMPKCQECPRNVKGRTKKIKEEPKPLEVMEASCFTQRATTACSSPVRV